MISSRRNYSAFDFCVDNHDILDPHSPVLGYGNDRSPDETLVHDEIPHLSYPFPYADDVLGIHAQHDDLTDGLGGYHDCSDYFVDDYGDDDTPLCPDSPEWELPMTLC